MQETELLRGASDFFAAKKDSSKIRLSDKAGISLYEQDSLKKQKDFIRAESLSEIEQT